MKFTIFKLLYKKIIQSIFFFIYGKIEGVFKGSDIKELKIYKIFLSKKLIYKTYIIKNARIYTDRIHNFAVIKKNRIVDGASYQIINNNFSTIKNNVTFKTGTPKFLKKIKGNVFSLLSGGGANENYFHWLYDVLPRFHLIFKKHNVKKINYFLVPNYKKPFQIETLKILGIHKKQIIESNIYRHFICNQIITTDHPYRFSNNSKKDVENIPIWITKWLRKKFLKKSKKKIKYKKIYIARKIYEINKLTRSITNENEIKNFLKKRGFKILYLENYSFSDQVSIFNNAKIIIGLHGAGFANLAFCKRSTLIIELMSKTTNNQIKNLAKQNKLNYFCIKGYSKLKTYNQQGNIEISLNLLKKKLNNTTC